MTSAADEFPRVKVTCITNSHDIVNPAQKAHLVPIISPYPPPMAIAFLATIRYLWGRSSQLALSQIRVCAIIIQHGTMEHYRPIPALGGAYLHMQGSISLEMISLPLACSM